MIYHKKTTNNNTYCDHDDDGEVYIYKYIYIYASEIKPPHMLSGIYDIWKQNLSAW